jgi:hypothetical protein
MSDAQIQKTSTNLTQTDQVLSATPELLISQSKALTYWNSIPATETGMLGGFEYISRMDLETSSVFLKKLRLSSAASPEQPFARELTVVLELVVFRLACCYNTVSLSTLSSQSRSSPRHPQKYQVCVLRID